MGLWCSQSHFGHSFAKKKQQPLSSVGTFLGLDYDFSVLGDHNHVLFGVRERLEKKVVSMMAEARLSGLFTPSQASKLYGTLNFLESGVFG